MTANDEDTRPIRSDADKRTNRANLDDEMDYVAGRNRPPDAGLSQTSGRGTSQEHVGGGGPVRDGSKPTIDPTGTLPDDPDDQPRMRISRDPG